MVDVGKNAPDGTIKIEPKAKTVLGPRPMGLALSPDGKQLYVSNGRGESVAVIDVATRKVTRLIDGVGARPWGIGVSRDGKWLYTANGPSGDVSVIDAATGKIEKRIKVGGLPWGLPSRPSLGLSGNSRRGSSRRRRASEHVSVSVFEFVLEAEGRLQDIGDTLMPRHR